jgi:peptide/nickel transport system ATP-binding protein
MEQGDVRRVFADPRHPYTRGLVGALPRADAPGHRLIPIPGDGLNGLTRPAGCIFAPRCANAEARCTGPSVLVAADDRTVRCWKSTAIATQLRPASEAPRDATPIGSVLVQATRLRRSFAKPRPWSTLVARLGRRAPLQEPAAVDGVDLAIHTGEILGLVGESGSGKSTLGRLLLQLLPADEGDVRFDGQSLAALRPEALRVWRQQAQMVFQNPGSSLNPRKTIGQIVGRPFALCGADAARRGQDVADMLDRVRLPPGYAERYPFALSGGEKQRVSIARALATKPRFLVLDEPVSALDVSVQASILNLLLDLREAEGLTYLFISHDLSVIAAMADRIAVMFAGAIVEIGPAARVLRHPQHPYTRTLLASVPGLRQTRPPIIIRPATNLPHDGI